MNEERWGKIEQLYQSALEQEPGRRDAFLAAACEGDEDLQRKVESLLAQSGVTDTLIDRTLSPDGKRLVAAVNAKDIQVYDWQRDSATLLTFTGANYFPVWTPDGRHIVFESYSPAGSFLRWIRSDGAGEAQQLLESKYDLRPYSFSPDGKRLAFSGNARGKIF